MPAKGTVVSFLFGALLQRFHFTLVFFTASRRFGAPTLVVLMLNVSPH
jgi:hypothetical protein